MINFNGTIDWNHFIILGNNQLIIEILTGMKFNKGMLVNKIIDEFGPDTEKSYGLVSMGVFAGIVYDFFLH